MDMVDYIQANGIEGTIQAIATKGPMGILDELGPGPGECRRIEYRGHKPCEEASVELVCGFVRRDYPVRAELKKLLAEAPTERLDVEGEDMRWQHLVVEHAGYRWRLRTDAGPIASEALFEEMTERGARADLATLSYEEEGKIYAEELAHATFETWRERMEGHPAMARRTNVAVRGGTLPHVPYGCGDAASRSGPGDETWRRPTHRRTATPRRPSGRCSGKPRTP